MLLQNAGNLRRFRRGYTTIWLLVAIALLVLKGLTLTTDDASNNGWLAPAPTGNTATHTPVEPTVETPIPEPTHTPTTEEPTTEPPVTTETPPTEVVETPVPTEPVPSAGETIPSETQQFSFNLPFN